MKVNYNEIFGVSESYQLPERVMKVLFNEEERTEIFMKLLQATVSFRIC